MGKSTILSLTIFAGFYSSAVHAAPGYPKLYFDYSYLYDSHCQNDEQYKILPEWADEAEARTPEFQKLWEKNEAQLMNALIDYFGRGFSRHEVTATLSVCNNGSMSNPLIVNVRPQLVSFMKPKPVRPEEAFTDTVFHELLHTFVVENLPEVTPLLTKYAAEPALVRNHLHVLAVEKFVYTLTGRQADLKWLDFVNHRIGGEYLRAWEIVDQSENYMDFVHEFPRP